MNKLLVDIPQKRIYKIKSKNGLKEYVYLTTKSYRNSKGNPTSDSVMIGIIDDETGKLIPNNNFFKLFDCEISIIVKGIK